MYRSIAAALLALVTLGLTDLHAQVILFGGRRPPQGSPIVGQPNTGGLFGGGLFGNGLFGGGTYAPPAGPAPNAPGYTTPGYTGRSTLTQQGDQQTVNQTGHPTRFLYYSHYFMNQGGSAGGAGAASQSPYTARSPEVLIGLGGGEYARAQGGIAPPRPPRAPSGGGRR